MNLVEFGKLAQATETNTKNIDELFRLIRTLTECIAKIRIRIAVLSVIIGTASGMASAIITRILSP